MKKLIFILLLCLTTSTFGQFFSPYQKPNLGFQVNGAHPLAPTAGWLFNEGSGGQVFDLSGNGLTGTFNGDITWKAGKFGPAPDFAGDTDYISAPTHPQIDGGIGPITYVVWFKSDLGGEAAQVILRVKDTMIRIYQNNFDWYPDIDIAKISCAYTFAAGVWYQLAVTQTGTSYTMYINGILVKSGATNALDLTSSMDVIIGSYNDAGLWDLDGQVDIPIIYNLVLSPSELVLLYREPFCYMEPSWNWVLYGGLAAPSVGGQFIFINQ